MTPVTGVLPYDLANLLGGAARVLVSDDSTALPAVPTTIKDVIDCVSPYAPKTGWVDFGATGEGTSYSRDMDSDGYEIQQSTGMVFEEITDISRTLTVDVAEITPEHVAMVENTDSLGTVAAATGAVAQKSVKFGSFTSLATRRVAFIAQRHPNSGIVDEGSIERGRFVMLCLYSVSIAADESEMTVEKGSLATLPITFEAFPESGQLQGEEYGTWLMEDAGTITP